MKLIEQGFNLKYEVNKVTSIKPGGNGMFQGNAYKASTKFRATNIVEKMNDDVGLQEIETILEFRVRCESNDEASKVSELIRKLRSEKSPIYINADIPRKQEQADIYNVESFDTGVDFMKLNTQIKKS